MSRSRGALAFLLDALLRFEPERLLECLLMDEAIQPAAEPGDKAGRMLCGRLVLDTPP